MRDQILSTFLAVQREEAMALAGSSDLLDLETLDSDPTRTYIARFRCNGLVRSASGIIEANRFEVGIRFPLDYLRHAPDPGHVLTWLSPHSIFHPNVRSPLICVGRLVANTTLVDLLFQIYELISWQNLCMVESNALNPAACSWARSHPERFPVDRRALRRSCVAQEARR